MLSRTRKYLGNSLAIHRYGIGTRDKMADLKKDKN